MRRYVLVLLLAFTTVACEEPVSPRRRAREASPPPPPPPTAAWAWQRHPGNPVIPADGIPARRGAHYVGVSDPSVLHEEGKFKMWFGYGGMDPDGKVRVRTGYAESSNGTDWQVTAPVFDPAGGRTWDKTNVETPSVVKDESLPAGHPHRYRLYYAGLDRELEEKGPEALLRAGMLYGIGLAFSSDGKRFTRLEASRSPHNVEGLILKPNPPVVDRDAWDFINVADPHVLRKDGRYHMWYTSMGRDARRDRIFLAIAYATSDDGIRWTKHGVVLRPELPWEVARPKEPSVGRPYVLWTGQRFEMFYDAVKDDDNPDKNTAVGVGFAASADGRVWRKEPQPVFVTNNGRGERRGIYIGSAVLVKDGKYHLYYPGADPGWQRYNINLATSPLRRP